MKRRSMIGLTTAAVLAVTLAAGWHGAAAASWTHQEAAVDRFNARVAAYADTRDLLRAAIARSGDAPDAAVVRRQLREGLRAVRAQARLGDVLAPDVATAFRARIWHTLTPRDLEAVVARQGEHAPDGLEVNSWCPVRDTGELPPVLLAVLPRLPRGLEFRLSGTDLVLLDVEVELVIDLIVDALAPLVYV